ncbi:MAG: tol-pal system protein YbgF [Desulfosarcina sp.]|nr:tol-pal system protein YbgF [Desulfobacterales bacterium]
MKSILLFFIVFFLLLSGCALREDVYNLDNRLASLERRYSKAESRNKQLDVAVQGITKISAGEDSKLRDHFARMHAELDGLRDEFRLLSGRLEETEHLLDSRIKAFEESTNKIQTGVDGLEKNVRSNKNHASRLEKYPGFKSAPVTGKKGTDSKTKKQSPDNLIYQKAKEAFDRGDFKSAREGFASLLKLYPNSNNADNAQFWIGEVYYREKVFKKAILEYQKVIEKYPEGNKAKAALLKQGFAFFNLGDTANARLIFKKLIKKYPASGESEIAINKLKAL